MTQTPAETARNAISPLGCDQPGSGDQDAARARRFVWGVRELLSFLFAGIGAIIRFWTPQREDLEAESAAESDHEPPGQPLEDRVADRIEAIAAKAAPYPGQDG